jgi:Family of unknown function (DUF6134)
MRVPFLIVLAVTLVGALPAHAAAARLLRYHVNHSVYGDVGTYSNTIERTGDITTVLTEAHFKVSLLGIVLHREDARREERWRGNRLVFFHGVTTANGRPLELTGEARGNSFVISSRGQTTIAPADVHPANPWSANFLRSDVMMRVDTGVLEQVHISGGAEQNLTIDGATVRAREYEITGKTRYKIWLGETQQIPVKFSVDDAGSEVTFTLVR